MGNFKNKEEFESRVSTFKSLLDQGFSINRSAREAGLSKWAYKIAKERDFEIKSRSSRNLINHTFFDVIDTEEKAYLLGFFLADGGIEQHDYVNSLYFHNSVDDREAIELFQKCICPENKISVLYNSGKKDSLRVKCSSKPLIQALDRFGIKPRKTYDFDFKFPFELLDKLMTRHFIRGFIDGDGTFTQGKVEFITTSLPFAKQLIELFETTFDVIGKLRSRETLNLTEYMFYFKTKDRDRVRFLTDLHDYLYKDSLCYLERKKKTLESHLNTVVR